MAGETTIIGPVTNALLLAPEGLLVALEYGGESDVTGQMDTLSEVTDNAEALLETLGSSTVTTAGLTDSVAQLRGTLEQPDGFTARDRLTNVARHLALVPREKFVKAADEIALTRGYSVFLPRGRVQELARAVLAKAETNADLPPEKRWPEVWNHLLKLAEEGAIGAAHKFSRYIQETVGPDHPLIDRLLRYLLEDAVAEGDDIGINQAIEVIYICRMADRLASEGLDGEFPCFFPVLLGDVSLIEVVKRFGHASGDISSAVLRNPWFWGFADQVISKERDPLMRYHLLRTLLIFGNLFQSGRYFSNDFLPERFLGVVLMGLQDSYTPNVLAAWETFKMFMDGPFKRYNLPWTFYLSPFLEARKGPEFRISKYVFGDFLERQAVTAVYEFLQESGRQEVSVKTLLPIHSLADYNPDPSRRKPIVEEKYQALKKIVAEVGNNRNLFFERFLTIAQDEEPRGLKILELSNGERFLIQGHHRIAALLLAAERGDIPYQWLEAIPANICQYKGSLPEVLAKHILTKGVSLSWTDLFPAPL